MRPLVLLLGQAASGGGTTTPPPPPVTLPTALDATVAAMRPNGRRLATYVVAKDGSGTHTSINAAVVAAKALQAQRMQAEGVQTITPNYRVDVVVKAGAYSEFVYLSAFVALYGDGRPTLTQPGPAPSAVESGVVISEGWNYIEGIDITRALQDNSATNWPKYPIHHTGNGTSIFADCVLNNADINSAGGDTAFGQDGATGGSTFLYKVSLKPGGNNSHGWDSTTSGHQTFALIGCTAPGGIVGWNALNDVAPDEMWLTDCTIGGVVSVQGAKTILHRNGGTAPDVRAVTVDTRRDWPVPTGGLSAADRAAFGM